MKILEPERPESNAESDWVDKGLVLPFAFNWNTNILPVYC